MFEASEVPRVFGVPPGVDFPRAVVEGIEARLATAPPEARARVTLFVNTRRMARRVRSLYLDRAPGFVPRLRPITDLEGLDAIDPDADTPDTPADATTSWARHLQLTELVRQVLARIEGFGAEDAAFDLATSLAELMIEMQRENVATTAFDMLDLRDHAAYWARSKEVLQVLSRIIGDDGPEDASARQRRIVERLQSQWAEAPPKGPVLVAGSTGSFGTTRLFMEAVAKLPQGAVILPGFDTHLPDAVWRSLDTPQTGEDHPQFRFRRILKNLALEPKRVPNWTDQAPESPERNALVSLALRPAPVTHAWLSEGPDLLDLAAATQALTWLEARDSKQEAQAIALRLRQAAEDGISAAVITPDRMLTRQITAVLQRWGIRPDDSAGTPLELTPEGRLIRQVGALLGAPLAPLELLALLKHPLVNMAMRADHLRYTRDLELTYLRGGPPILSADDLQAWAGAHPDAEACSAWMGWLLETLAPVLACDGADLAQRVSTHLVQCEALAAGKGAIDPGAFWLSGPGAAAHTALAPVREAAQGASPLPARDYLALIDAALRSGQFRDPVLSHPNIMIWGTLEARVQGADLVILAGLNDGTWPEMPKPDPWLNRAMRDQLGLLLPERRIGLAAHDFEQAIAAKEVWLTRARRSAEAETVPSRWLNRIRNLMEGLRPHGAAAFEAMTKRAAPWLSWADALDRPTGPAVPRAPRPAPRPPVAARPTRLSVTRIEPLIRNPYEIYARHILRLEPLKALFPAADAPLRGVALHSIMEDFATRTKDGLPEDDAAAVEQLMAIGREVLERSVPWTAIRALWLARLDRVAPVFLHDERARRRDGRPFKTEANINYVLPNGFHLHGRADRIDVTDHGEGLIYDYKSGALPNAHQVTHFARQLPLLALAASRGTVEEDGPLPIQRTAYIGLGSDTKQLICPDPPEPLSETEEGLMQLIAAYAQRSQGYVARRAVFTEHYGTDYDHLSRYGEWSFADDPVPEDVGP